MLRTIIVSKLAPHISVLVLALSWTAWIEPDGKVNVGLELRMSSALEPSQPHTPSSASEPAGIEQMPPVTSATTVRAIPAPAARLIGPLPRSVFQVAVVRKTLTG